VIWPLKNVYSATPIWVLRWCFFCQLSADDFSIPDSDDAPPPLAGNSELRMDRQRRIRRVLGAVWVKNPTHVQTHTRTQRERHRKREKEMHRERKRERKRERYIYRERERDVFGTRAHTTHKTHPSQGKSALPVRPAGFVSLDLSEKFCSPVRLLFAFSLTLSLSRSISLCQSDRAPHTPTKYKNSSIRWWRRRHWLTVRRRDSNTRAAHISCVGRDRTNSPRWSTACHFLINIWQIF